MKKLTQEAAKEEQQAELSLCALWWVFVPLTKDSLQSSYSFKLMT